MLSRAAFVVLLASVASAPGCGESKYDVYMRGLEIEGDAERGPCKLHYEQGEHAARLDRGQLTSCLVETQRALAEYEKAKQMGYADADFTKVFERAKERKARLEQMIEMVGQMERDAVTAKLPGAQ
jgi:hypothetical protein